ncbi:MAG TPA: SDR family oxidoreductase [Planctomycetaceae bacterium]|jgi:nucleoside-diphosphate-sugar epimerase|nr:SDR family oxidoreductase [Planctomycetaceae bacterium]
MQTLIIGCGYLGRRAAALWRLRGHAVGALTRSTKNAETLRSLGIEPIVGDVLEPSSLRSLPPADVVLYAVGYDRQAGAAKREVYVQGLENVLREVAPRLGRFLYVSSTSVYGQDAGEWVDETSPWVPATEDGQICLNAEEIARSYLPHGSDAIVLRFSGIYGPGRLLRRIESVRNREPILANPEGFLNLIHVDDGARVVTELAERGQAGATYLVTDNQPIRRREYYARLAELVGAAPPIFHTDAAAANRLNKRCSNARIRAELDDILRFPTIDTGLADAITSGSAVPPP